MLMLLLLLTREKNQQTGGRGQTDTQRRELTTGLARAEPALEDALEEEPRKPL